MRARFSPKFYRQYKKVNVRIRNSVDECISIFRNNPMDPALNNHSLREPYQNYRSVDITSDYRAHYKEVNVGKDTIAYFVALGTHDEFYKKPLTD